MSGERRALAWIALAALGLRLYIHLLSPVIGADSAYYLFTAERMRQNDLDGALQLYGLHPLYPFLVSLLGRLVPDLATAAVLISLAASTAVVFPLYVFFAAAWPPRIALAACAVYALHPIVAPETGDTLPTSTHLLCFTSALAAGSRALLGGPWALYPLAGACAALAYLTRTEGLLASILLGGAAVVALARPRPGRARLALGAAAALLTAAAVSAPYVVYLTAKAGRFAITAKGGGQVLLQGIQGKATDVKGPRDTHAFLPTLWRKGSYAFFLPLLPFLIAGLVLDFRTSRDRLCPLLIGAAALAPPIVMFVLNRHFRPSNRYFLTGVVLLLPWTALAATAGLDALRRRFPSSPWPSRAALGLFLALLLGKNALPHRPQEISFRDAGRWLAANATAGPIVSSSEKLSWYARARHVPFDPGLGDARSLCRAGGASLLVLDSSTLKDLGGAAYLDSLKVEGFTQVHEFPPEPGRLGIWILRAP